ncbi:MAG: Hpt domain-containing protein [Bryobacteraceae bacterium]|jgi:HPt (histidine-containing phosphotransfer) domain-containing protein
MFHEQTDSKSRVFVHPPEDLPYKVVAAYLDKCRKGLQSLQDAIDKLDYDYIGVYAHQMKGSGGAYGFPELTEIAAAIEQAAGVRDGAALRTSAATLEAHLGAFEVLET